MDSKNVHHHQLQLQLHNQDHNQCHNLNHKDKLHHQVLGQHMAQTLSKIVKAIVDLLVFQSITDLELSILEPEKDKSPLLFPTPQVSTKLAAF